MNNFSISQLSQFSGVKTHTIRMWEKRYGALNPKRSAGNTRYYDNDQLRRLLNIVSLKQTEYKISQLCSMPDQQLFQLLEAQQNKKTKNELSAYFISQLIAAGINFNELQFEKIFSHCLLQFGIKKTYVKVIYPLLTRMGFLWIGRKLPPAQEHFISNLLKRKLYTAIDSLPPGKKDAEIWLLFLPENEFHEVGLLFSNYLIRRAGKKVIYLGSNVPFESLNNAVKEAAANNLLLFLVQNDLPENIQKYLDRLDKQFTGSNIYLAVNDELNKKIKPGNIFFRLRSAEDLEKVIEVDSLN